MIVFGVDSSTQAGSAALMRDGVLVAESYADVGLTHSERLLVLCDEVFQRAGIQPSEVDVFAVTCGPGSFTGLRIGIGTVQGFAFATGARCVGLSTMAALAHNVADGCGTVVAVLDARRGRVYHAAFAVANGAVELRSADAVVEIAALSSMYENERILLVGDGAQMCYNVLKETVDCRVAPPHLLLPRAAAVCDAALEAVRAGDTVDAASLIPNYIQLPQATRELLEKENGT